MCFLYQVLFLPRTTNRRWENFDILCKIQCIVKLWTLRSASASCTYISSANHWILHRMDIICLNGASAHIMITALNEHRWNFILLLLLVKLRICWKDWTLCEGISVHVELWGFETLRYTSLSVCLCVCDLLIHWCTLSLKCLVLASLHFSFHLCWFWNLSLCESGFYVLVYFTRASLFDFSSTFFTVCLPDFPHTLE